MARTKGAVGKGVDNKDVRDYLLAHGPLSHQPHIVDHSLRGAKGQEKDSHRYSNERIFAMLRQLDYINATTVFNQMQAYNNSKGKKRILQFAMCNELPESFDVHLKQSGITQKNGVKRSTVLG